MVATKATMRELFFLVFVSVAANATCLGGSDSNWFVRASPEAATASATATATPTAISTSTTSASGTATPVYRIRRGRRAADVALQLQANNNNNNNNNVEQQHPRELFDFLPSFSADDETTVDARMPDLALLMKGLDGSNLGDRTYDALQTAMNDYLLKLLAPYFSSSGYELEDARTKVVGDRPLLDDVFGVALAEGNVVTLETILIFKDNDGSGSGRTSTTDQSSSFGEQMALNARIGDFEDRESNDERVSTSASKTKSTSTSTSAPTPMELELAAGHAWNDLSVFKNYLLVGAAVDEISAFDTLETVDSQQKFPTSTGAVAQEDESEDAASGQSPEVRPPQREDITAPNKGDGKGKDKGTGKDKGKDKDKVKATVAAASSQELKQSGTNRLNPLWPALIVGMTVFLITMVVLGYRRRKNKYKDNEYDDGDDSDNDSIWRKIGGGMRSTKRRYSMGSKKNKSDVLVHVNNNKIEVEDRHYSSAASDQQRDYYPYKPQRNQKQHERDLDKEYAASCLRPAAMALSPSHYNACEDHDRDDDSDDYRCDNNNDGNNSNNEHRDYYDHGGGGSSKKNCFPAITRKGKKKKIAPYRDGDDNNDNDNHRDEVRSSSSPLQDQDSMALDRNNRRGIALPQGVDLTNNQTVSTNSNGNGTNNNGNGNSNNRRRRSSKESWRNLAQLDHQVEDHEQDCDLTDTERLKFVRYMQSGMSLQDASSQVLSERNKYSKKKFGNNSGAGMEEQQGRRQSSYSGKKKNTGGQRMEDGETTIHVPNSSYTSPGVGASYSEDQDSLDDILDDDGSNSDGSGIGRHNKKKKSRWSRKYRRRGSASGRAMIITEASSYASSYNDNDFSRAVGESSFFEDAMA